MTTFTSLDAVAAFIDASPGRLIGLAGAPGAGKSTIAAELVQRLDSAALLAMDGYHLPQQRLVELSRRERMGAPDTFDVEAFVATLADVHNSCTTVLAPGFDREIEQPIPNAIVLLQELSTVIVEGNYLLLDSGGWQHVAPLLDVTFFVGVADDVRRGRLIERHVRFGKSEADATAWALGPDESNARIIATTAHRADHVIELPQPCVG